MLASGSNILIPVPNIVIAAILIGAVRTVIRAASLTTAIPANIVKIVISSIIVILAIPVTVVIMLFFCSGEWREG